MVDPETVRSRLARLHVELRQLARIHGLGRDAYLDPENEETRAAAERHLQVAEQVCIDVGSHLSVEVGAPTPETYAGIFEGLERAGIIGRDLAEWLKLAASQRNVLVHMYQEVDHEQVWDVLEELERFREFAEAASRAAGIEKE